MVDKIELHDCGEYLVTIDAGDWLNPPDKVCIVCEWGYTPDEASNYLDGGPQHTGEEDL